MRLDTDARRPRRVSRGLRRGPDAAVFARSLYQRLRRADADDLGILVVVMPPPEAIGLPPGTACELDQREERRRDRSSDTYEPIHTNHRSCIVRIMEEGWATAQADRGPSEHARSVIRVTSAGAANTAGAVRSTSRGEQHMAWLAVAAAAGAFGIAVVVAVRVAVGGPVAAVIETDGGRAVLGFAVDRLAGVVLVLVTGISLTVQVFSVRYLRGDRRAGRFFAGSATLTVATSAVATAATLTGLVAAWVLVSVSVCVLLAHRTDLPEARFGVRRAAQAFVVGDLALIAAAVLVVATVGDLDLRSIATVGSGLAGQQLEPVAWLVVPVAPVVAVLVVVAALARSAQLPLPRWLPATLAAPTPVSALLHAGVVNAGGLLLIRLSPLLDRAPAATHLALVAGAITAVAASAAMLVRPDVKGALAQSTVAQMGFMVVQCAVGAFGAAAFHLVAHAMYKAALFLGSGSAINHHGRRSAVPSPGSRRPAALRYALAGLLPVAAVTIVAVVVDPPVLHHRGGWLVAGFAWITGAHATWGWLDRGPSFGRAVTAAAALVMGAAAYLGAVSGFDAFLAPALAKPGPGFASPWWAAAIAVTVGVTAAAFATGRWEHRRDRVWVAVVGIAHTRPAGFVEPAAVAGDDR